MKNIFSRSWWWVMWLWVAGCGALPGRTAPTLRADPGEPAVPIADPAAAVSDETTPTLEEPTAPVPAFPGFSGAPEAAIPEPPRTGGFFLQTSNAFALITSKKVREEIPYYRPKTEWDVLSLQAHTFGVGQGVFGTRFEYAFGLTILDQVGEPDAAGIGLFLGMEWGFEPWGPWHLTVWGHGFAALFNHSGESGDMQQVAAGGGLHYTVQRWFRLFVRAGLGGQWIDTSDVDVIWARPRELAVNSLIVVLTAGVVLDW